MNIITREATMTVSKQGVVDAETRRAVENFLFLEAEFADNSDYDAWLALWDEELLYWIPSNQETVDPAKAISIIYDKRPQLEDRVYRLKSKRAHAQSPKSRVLRVISNVTVTEGPDDTLIAVSKFVMGEVRSAHQEVTFGKTHHVLRRTGDSFLIREKKIFILSNDMPMRNLTFLV